MQEQQELLIKKDFKKYLDYLQTQHVPFSFEVFVDFSTSLLNFYIGSSIISIKEKQSASFSLIKLFNAGLKTTISQDDMLVLSNLITENPKLDYSVIEPIFSLDN